MPIGGMVLQELTLASIETDPFGRNNEGSGFDLFRRLSRTPGLQQKERFCVEVLASVLSSAPTIRRGFVSKLAEITRLQVQEGLRRIADYHTHRTMTKSDSYPSENQVEPFKPQFEFLLHQILSRLS